MFDYYNFQTNRAVLKITEEIEFYENHEFHNYPFIREYITYLKGRLGNSKNYIVNNNHFKNNLYIFFYTHLFLLFGLVQVLTSKFSNAFLDRPKRGGGLGLAGLSTLAR